jgi:3-oxoacyl-[acyl-carrier protein] reductase
MDLGLASCRAFVAASSAGIGRACAEGLLAEGARVAISGRDPAKLEAARAELAQRGEVHAVAADLNGAGATAAVERAIALLGGLDVLVVNGGGPPPGPTSLHDDATWSAAYESTVLGPVRMVRAAGAALAASGRGRIIFITSTSVKQPIDRLALSNSLRLAVVGLAKTLSLELARAQVTVNVVCPGMTDTDRLRELDRAQSAAAGITPDAMRARRKESIPMGRFAEPAEVAALCTFLASRQAAYLTGATIAVDGGLVRYPL